MCSRKERRYPACFAAAVEVDGDGDLGFAGIAVDGNAAAAGSRCGFGNSGFGSSGAFCGGFGDSAFAVFSVEPAFGFAGVFSSFAIRLGRMPRASGSSACFSRRCLSL